MTELGESKVWQFFLQICLALEFIHEKGIVHADLKPSNLLLTGRENLLKLTDFGVSLNIINHLWLRILTSFLSIFNVILLLVKIDQLEPVPRIQFFAWVQRHDAILQPRGSQWPAIQLKDRRLGPRLHPLRNDCLQARVWLRKRDGPQATHFIVSDPAVFQVAFHLYEHRDAEWCLQFVHEEASRGKAKRKGDLIAGHCAGAGPTPLNQPWAPKHQSEDHARPA